MDKKLFPIWKQAAKPLHVEVAGILVLVNELDHALDPSEEANRQVARAATNS